MFKQDIVTPKGTLYTTVVYDGSLLRFEKFGPHGVTVVMDAHVVEQLLPILQSIKLIQWSGAVNK